MSSFLKICLAALLAALASLIATPASAQTRTWVSGEGSDANPCSRAAPCLTFAGAISKTAAGGEINCLDAGGFGTLTITKSITIDCTGTFASILNANGTNGIVIDDPESGTSTVEVVLRGLAINGAAASPGQNGIRFLNGRSLVVQDVFIQGQSDGNGISFQPESAAEFYAEDVTINDSDGGIRLDPSGNGGVNAVLRNVRSQNNSGAGLTVDTTGVTPTPTNGVNVTVDKSSFTGNIDGIVITGPTGAPAAVVMVNDSVISNNSSAGISAAGANARARVGNTVITRNRTGVFKTLSANVHSYGTNRLDGNITDGTFTAPLLPQE